MAVQLVGTGIPLILFVQISLEEAVRQFFKCDLYHTLQRVQEERACEKRKPLGPDPQEF